MKKIILFLLVGMAFLPAGAQSYLKPVITHSVSSTACDASIELIPYNMDAPYNVIAYESKPLGNTLRLDSLCSTGYAESFWVQDASCRKFRVYVNSFEDITKIPVLDTVTGTQPTPGNLDGSLQFYFDHLPSGYSLYFESGGHITAVSVTGFTGLGQGYHTLIIRDGSKLVMTVPVLLGPGPGPCNYTDFEVSYIPPSAPVGTTDYCNGEIKLYVEGELADEYSTAIEQCVGGGFYIITNDSAAHIMNICRGVYKMAAWPYDDEYRYPYRFYFVQDSSDVHYTWGSPGVLPPSVDTLVLSATENKWIDYDVPLDTMYISAWRHIGADQYEITFTVEQGGDGYVFRSLTRMDSTTHYFLDLTFFNSWLLNETHEDHYRNLVYFAALNTRHMTRPVPDAAPVPTVYPNPFSDHFSVQSETPMIRAELYSLTGVLLKTVSLNDRQFNWEGHDLQPGIYLLRIYDRQGHFKTVKLSRS